MTPNTSTPAETLTDEQVENWRRVLMMTVGPYALYMTREQIQKYRDRVQAVADSKAEGKQNE